MLKKFSYKLIGVVFATLFVMMCLNINYVALFEMPLNMYLSTNDLNELNTTDVFGRYIQAEINDNIVTVGGEKRRNTSLNLKLFGFLPIKTVDAVIKESSEVYLGGIPLGFSIYTKGLIVVGENKVDNNDSKNPFKTGDIITHINEEEIEKPVDVGEILSKYENEVITIKFIRNNEEKELVVMPYFDEEAKENKLGLWVRDEAQGIGTLTFVTKDGKFGALGHAICDYETGVEIPVKEGGIYHCNLIGINKAEKRKTGELRCLFSQGKAPIGEVKNNTRSGVFGVCENYDSLIDNNLTANIGNRMLVKLGKASIISSVSGVREEYDIEIIKAKYQPSSNDKSFVFRVIDKRLIGLTGGIVQGMSGSPILQNGKIIGAITHVFLNDATKGYGIYLDWMLEELP